MALKSCFFVDANAIMAYNNDIANVRDFIDERDSCFCFTETTGKRLERQRVKIPERFNFRNSGLPSDAKKAAIELLSELWHEKFYQDKHHTRKGFSLSRKELLSFQNELYTAFEASSCYCISNEMVFKKAKTPLILPSSVLEKCPLIINDDRFSQKFLLRKEAKELLDMTVKLSGFHHLIPIFNLENIIEEWLE